MTIANVTPPTGQYDFVWASISKPGFTVLPQTKDITSTSLTLTGRGSANWGRDLQENMMLMLEHFASPNAPLNPTTGQLWYNTTTKTMHLFDASLADPWPISSGGAVASTTPPSSPRPGDQWYGFTSKIFSIWDGSAWQQIYPVKSSTVSKAAYVEEYNSIAQILNSVVGPVQGSTISNAYGWGQNVNTPLSSVGVLVNADWISLVTKLKDICSFLGIDSSGVDLYGFMYESGNVIPYGMVTMLSKYASMIAITTTLTTGVARFKPVSSHMESAVPGSGTASHSTIWHGTLTHEVIATFSNSDSAKAFFNSGGQLQFFGSLSNPVTNVDFQWMNFFGQIGTVKYSATGAVDSQNRAASVGFYDLTSTYTPIYTIANTVNVAQIIKIEARMDSVNVVHFRISFIDPGTLYGGVGGTIISSTNLVKASSAAITSPVIAYPVITQTPLQ